jgi:hypothetical protein
MPPARRRGRHARCLPMHDRWLGAAEVVIPSITCWLSRRLVLRAHSLRWNTCSRWEEAPTVNRGGRSFVLVAGR